MNRDKLYELILDYLDNNLESSQLGLLKSELKQMGYDISDLSALQKLVNEMDGMNVPEPSPQMSANFYAMLEEKSNELEEADILEKISNFFRSVFQPAQFPKFAYASLILILGWVIGYWFTPKTSLENKMNQMSSEMQVMQTLVMESMIEKPLASDRLKAIQLAAKSQNASEDIIRVLLKTLNNDPDANVRMAAVDALLAFANKQDVRDGLKASVLQQKSPLVQLTLVDGLVAINDKKAVSVFQDLISRSDVHQLVKERSKEGINKLI